MRFEDFIKKGQVRRSSKDISLIKALYKNTLNDLTYLASQKVTLLSARKVVTNYYDCLRSVLEAVASIEGYKVYQHEAFTYFLKEKNEEIIAIKLDRFRKICNRLSYYGEDIPLEEAKELVAEIKKLTNDLIQKYLKEYKNGL